jgi:hypothetical protein
MERDDEAGDVLQDVARIHPAVDRLRDLLTSAAILDLKAARTYWTDRRREAESPQPQRQTA